MNRSLRKRHRAMFITLAVIVPLLFLAGLGVRQSIPTVQDPTAPPAARGRGDLEVLREDAIIAKMPGIHNLRRGETVRLSAEASKLHMFDAKGTSLLYR